MSIDDFFFYLEHGNSTRQHRSIVLACTGERFDAPKGAEAERPLFAADSVVGLCDVVPVDQVLVVVRMDCYR